MNQGAIEVDNDRGKNFNTPIAKAAPMRSQDSQRQGGRNEMQSSKEC